MAFSKHAKRGGPEYIQALYDNYVLEHNIDLLSRGLSICGVELPGLRQAFRLCWWLLGVDPSMVPYFHLVTSPYFYPRTYPIKIESGFGCEGCKRDKRVVRGSDLRRGIPCDELGIHLEVTFPSHFRTYLTARQIKQGVFLTVSEEDDMTRALCLKREEYWPKGHSTPQKVIHFCGRLQCDSNWTASEFRTWHSKAIHLITEMGEGDLRCRQWLTDFTTTIDTICRILNETATTSMNGITPSLVDECRKVKSVQDGLTHRSRVAWKPRRSKYELSLINQISAISVPEDVDLPSWRTLPEMMSKSGGHQIPEDQPAAAV
jgi:hypothetical protein